MDGESTNGISRLEVGEQETEAIIAAIIESAIREQPGDEVTPLVVLSYGGKELDLIYFEEVGKFTTSLEGYKDRENKPGETRLLFLAARKLMQEITDREQKELEYAIETLDEKMIKFSQSHGKNIFDWDTETERRVRTKKGEIFKIRTFRKTFKPNTSITS